MNANKVKLTVDAESNNILARRKKQKLPEIGPIIEALQKEFDIQVFKLQDIPDAVTWAERGNIAIHENYHSRRRQSYHIICGDKDNLVRFCHRIGVNPENIKASEFFRFWHLTWFPHLQTQACLPNVKGSNGLTYIHPSS